MRQRQQRRGFTLVELLVSSIIVSLGLVAVSQLYLGATMTMQKARYLSVATQRAQYELEKVRNLGYDGLINGVNSANPTMEDAYFQENYAYFSDRMGVSFTVADLPNGRGTVRWSTYPSGTAMHAAKMLKATVEIDWDGSPRAQSKVKVVSFLTQGYK